ncbi:head-tail adaptor protein [Pseudomonas plecoglossicida]|uniref:phage head closure protein n=1 Tax=Pseudomonas TaxID=286 RepID=UPI000C7B8069|nr:MULTISPECIES: phage head closure protein [Pseudomonas]CAB5637344.1 Bacteriophage head-tail adaptor [Pseudomonas putida]MBO2923265.1 phage head closure protein [Pseudomonas asiatica]PLU98438.1 head-tail adaptor protein [Pseudomonas plecoglossicida]PLV06534.1 head-tail adaptor protein [Pseudomonas plecoglossicida]WPU60215.1 phage head closure protein [Pseudomonas asiatica]
MKAGPMRHRCRIFKPHREQNRSGGATETWLEVCEVWAEVTTPTGRVSPVAEQLQGVISAEIRIRPRSDILAGWRLTEKRTGMTYQVEAPLLNNERDMLRLLCSSVPNP